MLEPPPPSAYVRFDEIFNIFITYILLFNPNQELSCSVPLVRKNKQHRISSSPLYA